MLRRPRYSLLDVDPALFTDPSTGYVALVSDTGQLIGYRCFGVDGQVPGFYNDDKALDTGGGLRPSLTGKGLGKQSIAIGLAYGLDHFRPDAFRVTIASFNVRAQRVVLSLGFAHQARFNSTTDGTQYDVFARPA